MGSNEFAVYETQDRDSGFKVSNPMAEGKAGGRARALTTWLPTRGRGRSDAGDEEDGSTARPRSWSATIGLGSRRSEAGDEEDGSTARPRSWSTALGLGRLSLDEP